MIVLSPARELELVDALAEAFTPDDLERRVMEPLRVPGVDRSRARAYKERARELVQWAKRTGRIGDLLQAARQGNPNSLRIRLLAEATGLVPSTEQSIEAIRPALAKGGERTWLRRLAETQNQVCRIVRTAGGKEQGSATGFLVGPDQVMTHFAAVTSDVTKVAEALSQVELQVSFGADAPPYRVERDVVFGSADGVVVLRLDRPAGRDLAGNPSSSLRARGWLTPRPRPVAPGNAVVIVQYVEGGTLAVAIELDGRVANAPAGVIRYRTSTQLGSLGAPCFDAEWRLIGMHVSHDAELGWNQGIGIDTIESQLKANGFAWDSSSGLSRTMPVAAMATSLDDVVRGYDVASALDPDEDVWEASLEGSASSAEERWAWAEAAAVLAYYEPGRLTPWGKTTPEARVAVLLESQPVRRRDGRDRWMLSDKLRVRALSRLAKRGELRAARDANPGDPDEPLDVLLGAFIAGVRPEPAAMKDPDRLRAILSVATWLDGLVSDLPPLPELRAALERATLIAPFRHLTRGFFAGREPELATLSAYVDGPDVDASGATPAPILIFGPGGMGKSALLAHFILAHSERDPTDPTSWRPFIYLDFDRPELDAKDLVGVLLASVRQIGPQVPSVRSRADALLDRATSRRAEARPRPATTTQNRPSLIMRVRREAVEELTSDLAELLGEVFGALPAPIVLVLDTLEEVQYATPDAIAPLAELVVALRAKAPMIRPVLAGRVEIDSVELAPMPLGPLPPAAAEAVLANDLPPELAARTDIVSRMARVVGGNPLSLKLAAELLRRESEQTDKMMVFLEEDLWRRVGDAIVQGRLYERILAHIHEGPVKKLAYPGLVLRRVTPELIREVLAGPCELEVPDDATARLIFAALSAEVALVRQGRDPDSLELRPELRRIVLDDFANDPSSEARRRQIHQAAVAFYAGRRGTDDRAEEIYHRLALDEDPETVDARWSAGLEPALRNAVDELPPRARAYLANRVGVVLDADVADTAGPVEWDAWAERRASDLIRLGSPARALEILAMRSERLEKSRLHLIESVARRSLPTPDLSGAEAAAERAVTAAGASGDPGELREALTELVQVARMGGDIARVLSALAELADLGDQLGDDLILLQAEVESLEAVGAEGRARFSDDAVRVFGRLPDELVAGAPDLARRLAAQVGDRDPATLQRVIRLVGTGGFDAAARDRLEQLLRAWERKSPEIASFVPATPATAHDLAGATQYLAGTKTLDDETAAELSDWLKTVVTPG